MKSFSILVALSIFFLVTQSCSKVDCTTIDYTTVKPIIDDKCASSACHSEETHANEIDASSYQAMLPMLIEGDFYVRTLLAKDMPPVNDLKQLTKEEFKMLECWHEAGYPE